MKNRLKKFDYGLIIVILALSVFGLIMVYSSSYTLATRNFGSGHFFFLRQLQWFGIGLIVFVVMSFISLKKLGEMSPLLVGLAIILLALVLIPGVGVVRNQAQRWIGAGPIVFQPSEIVKVFMIIYFAHIYTRKQKYINDFKKGVMPPLVILAFVFGLILMQPDLGTGTHIVLICGLIVLFSGVKFYHIALLGSVAAGGFYFFAQSQPYRLQRLTSFANAFDDPSGDGFQLINSYVSIGTSGLTGNGLGNSVQKLGYLPEAHTDFIMSVIVEELGIIGVTFVIGGYLFILYRGIQISKEVDSLYLRLLALGITFQFITQAFFNLGAVSGLLPITGIPLPFISYGGTSLVFTLLAAGILVNVSGRRTQPSTTQQETR
ncbi:cell division protein FtsW [Pelagirhabdus alkalitolerans]|uniref:Probable peptidoglycan glycosyltransferase FtsW n=1 Tax=Pelagirhabdus alkalitolerans TaxID=1612202 RepID=A0A1G6KFS2_9BACI|nr:putative lipid II flippase FtsW [Pelagirhabdus alkalitolerans]SDC29435.1 cell division protein FtsW [Pelagirhabdus alkalitolerans]